MSGISTDLEEFSELGLELLLGVLHLFAQFLRVVLQLLHLARQSINLQSVTHASSDFQVRTNGAPHETSQYRSSD